jgi:hypothetical protein
MQVVCKKGPWRARGDITLSRPVVVVCRKFGNTKQPFSRPQQIHSGKSKPALSEAQVRNIIWLGKFFALLNFIFSVLERNKSLSCCEI